MFRFAWWPGRSTYDVLLCPCSTVLSSTASHLYALSLCRGGGTVISAPAIGKYCVLHSHGWIMGFIASAERSVSKLMALRLGPQTLSTLLLQRPRLTSIAKWGLFGKTILELRTCSRDCRASDVNPDIAARSHSGRALEAVRAPKRCTQTHSR